MQTDRVQRVLIAVQARSTSQRLPSKGLAVVGDVTVTEMILNSIADAVSFMRRSLQNVDFTTALLIPTGDPLKRLRVGSSVVLIEGDEFDVLSRFQKAFAFYRPDYIVRLTGDCPLIPDYVISKHIRSAIYGQFDYVTNADPRFTTCADGYDCEVMSKRMMRWVVDNAKTKDDLEHVTISCKERPPEWAKICNIVGYIDMSHVKLSVDTVEDLERVRAEHNKLEAKLHKAKSYRPKSIVMRL